MKTSYSCSLVAIILLLCTNGIQAQTTQPKLNQMELMKQYLGIWKGELTKDTVMILNFTSYGKAIENNYKIVTQGKILYSGKEIYGYNQKYDKIILAAITDYSPRISLAACWFSSRDTGNLVGYQYLANPEKDNNKMQWILIPPDSAKRIVYQNNKVINASTYFREKQ
jgi:hypothetical protein